MGINDYRAVALQNALAIVQVENTKERNALMHRVKLLDANHRLAVMLAAKTRLVNSDTSDESMAQLEDEVNAVAREFDELRKNV